MSTAEVRAQRPRLPQRGAGAPARRYALMRAARARALAVCAGLFTFAYLTSGLHFANVRMREQVALKEQRSRFVLVLVLGVLLSTLAATLLLFRDEQLWLRLVFLAPSAPAPQHPRSVLAVVWCIVVTDVVARYASMAIKVALTLCLCATPHRRLRQLYRLSEMSFGVYRSALPMPQWYLWLLADGSSHLFSSLVTGLYLTFKLAAVVDQLRAVSSMCRSTLLQQSVHARRARVRPGAVRTSI